MFFYIILSLSLFSQNSFAAPEKTDSDESQIKAHISDLKETKISSSYYNSAIKDKICPYLKDLKKQELAEKLDPQIKKEFFSGDFKNYV